jgi:hypothetical protein
MQLCWGNKDSTDSVILGGSDCNKLGYTHAGSFKAFSSKQPGTQRYCTSYGYDTQKNLFKAGEGSSVCTFDGWGQNGEFYAYTSQQPGTKKYCFNATNDPWRSYLRGPDPSNCTDGGMGPGEFWAQPM